jgi:DNA-binding NarL/FixJ family response regulator
VLWGTHPTASGLLSLTAGQWLDRRLAGQARVAVKVFGRDDAEATLLKSARQTPARPADLPDDLTEREAEVLALIAEGLSNAEIA